MTIAARYDPKDEWFRCTYEPCGHSEQVRFFNEYEVRRETRHCPKCNLFTFKWIPLPPKELDAFMRRVSEDMT